MNKIFIFLILATLLFPTMIVLGADDLSYTVLAPLPGIGDSGDKTTTLEKYVPAVFKLAIGLSAVAAVLMIVIGGFQYISSDAIMKKSEGKERIKNAVFGLVLVISAWLILNTINPNLLNINLNIETITTKTMDGGSLGTLQKLGGESSAGTGKKLEWYPLSKEQIAKNSEMITDLKKYNVEVNHGPCIKEGVVTGCTNLVGMPAASYQGVKDLAKAIKGTVTITGGTEGGHASHGLDKPVLDLRSTDPLLNNWVKDPKNHVAPVGKAFGYPAYTVKISDNLNATFVQEGDHWHVMFGK